ncbi:MAG: septal ring lytic transglycosylase RlpA family protein [Gammaproteobacteria bacterium]
MIRALTVLLLLSLLGGCTGLSRSKAPGPKAGPAPVVADPGQPDRRARGNPVFYEVFGERYYVSSSSAGYREKGVASWYGTKFHGRPTSSGEPYDMYAMTAAHKTLPLPTRVRVTNLRNQRSVIVMVNDRGPFIDNRIIDMSYAAAQKLDMTREGTALVTVEALPYSETEIPAPQATRTITSAAAPAAQPKMYLQVGAFGESANAQLLKQRLESDGLDNVLIKSDEGRQPAIYRVRLGPIADVTEYDQLVQRVASLDIRDVHLVTEAPQNRPGG